MADNKLSNQICFYGYIAIALILLFAALFLTSCEEKECRTCEVNMYTWEKYYLKEPFYTETYEDCYVDWEDKTIRVIPGYPNDTIITRIVCMPNE